MMITLYTWGANRVFAGTVSADPFGPMPGSSTPTAPPETTGTQVPQWTGAGWVVLPEAPLPPVQPEPPPEQFPLEIPMHKVRKALKRLGPAGTVAPEDYLTDSWWSMVMAVIETLPARQRDEIFDELNTAPNMVLAGASTQMIQAAIGMTNAHLEAVARLAVTLP